MNDRVDELDLPLPPRRPLPPEVRGRVRGTVFSELDAPARTRLDRIRPPLAVAASVAVLAAGAVIVAQSVDGSGGNDPLIPPPPTASATPEPPPLDPEAARFDLDRCAAAVQTAGKAASLPARDTWVPVFAVPNRGRTVTAVRAAGVPLFCETTRTTVTVSNPDVAPGFAKDSETAALLISKDGAMAGIADPVWPSMVVSTFAAGGGSGGPVIIKDGLWVHFSDTATGPGARFTVRQTIPGHPEAPHPVGPSGVSTPAKPGEVVPGQTHPELDLPRAPEPLVSLTDGLTRPADRTSARGRFLADCMAKSHTAVVDPDAWEPVAITGTAPYQAVLARFGDELVACGAQGWQTNPDDLTEWVDYHQLYPQYRPIEAGKPIQYITALQIGRRDGEAMLGLIRPDVASMELLADGRAVLPVPIADGAFAVSYRTEPVSGPDRPAFTVVLRNESGDEIHRGSLSDFF